MQPNWLRWAQELSALAQNGLTYNDNPFDVERYERIRAIAAEMMAEPSGVDPAVVLDLLGGEAGYATPKVDVRGFALRDDRVLLVRERMDGLWTLPGGWADPGDSPREAVEREITEEAGYAARATRLLYLCDRNRHPFPPFAFAVYKFFFQCDLLGGEPRENYEILDVGFFAHDALPELSLTRILPEQLERMWQLAADPDHPTVFD